MTVSELIIRLRRLNPSLDICFETKDGAVSDFTVEDIVESCDDPTLLAYILCERRAPLQLEFDFTKERIKQLDEDLKEMN
jgi:hypothetical protein